MSDNDIIDVTYITYILLHFLIQLNLFTVAVAEKFKKESMYLLQVKIKLRIKFFNLGWFSISFVS